MEKYESNYLLYEDFSNELEPLAEQEWVLFRSKTYLFDEFLQRWLDKLKEVYCVLRYLISYLNTVCLHTH